MGNAVSPERYGMSTGWPAGARIVVTSLGPNGRTKFTLEHSPLPSGSKRDKCRQNWDESLGKVDEYLCRLARFGESECVSKAML